MQKVFVSYNKSDLQWAEWIAWQIEAAGHSAILQAWDFRPGSNFILQMHRAIEDSDRIIAVLSPSYLGADFTQSEWAAAFLVDPESTERRLIPVRVQECKPTGLLAAIVYVDLVGVNEADAQGRLTRALEDGRPKPAAPPPFPGQDIGLSPAFPGASESRPPARKTPIDKVTVAVPAVLINLRASRIRVTVNVEYVPATFRLKIQQEEGFTVRTDSAHARGSNPFDFDFTSPGTYTIDVEIASKSPKSRNALLLITCFSGNVMLHKATHRVTVLEMSILRQLIEAAWRSTERLPPVILRIPLIFLAALALLIGSNYTPIRFGETVRVWILGLPDNEKLMAKAWKSYNQGAWPSAIVDADNVIKRFRKFGEGEEAGLERLNEAAPPVGHVGPSQTFAVLERDPLNFLGTAYWIQAQAFEQLNDREKARASYCACMRLKYARAWDPHGWPIRGWSPYGEFWSPADRAASDFNETCPTLPGQSQ